MMKKPLSSVLIVNRDKEFVNGLTGQLKNNGIKIMLAENGFDAILSAKKNSPGLIIFDSGLPKMNGIESGRIIKQDLKLKDTLIYFLINDAADQSAINELKDLADDCFLKPVNINYLAHRINDLVSVKKNGKALVPEIPKKNPGNLLIDRETYMVHFKGQEFNFPKKEFELLFLLASSPEKVFTRKDIFKTVWNKEINNLSARTIDVHIRKLREKLNGINIVTVKGVGYKLSEKEMLVSI
jgi:two-component system alkaline phosphatase synthesis response regulator PhoP